MSFQKIGEHIDRWVDDGIVTGASMAIIHHGELVARHNAGEGTPGQAVTDETLFGLASLSKPITAATFMALCDDDVLDLDLPVVEILPEFGANVDVLMANAMLEAQRDSITFRQLLAHTSGLPENTPDSLFDPATLGSRDTQIDIMMQVPLISSPGEQLRYSNIGPGIAARAAETVSGMPFPRLVNERLLAPMGLENIVLNPSTEHVQRIVHLQDAANPGTNWESYNSAWWQKTAIPWGGYYGTTTDMARFTASFLPRDRRSFLSAASIEAMTKDQIHGVSGGVESMRTMWHPGFWGVGWEIKGSKPKHWTGNLTSPQSWDHWGFAGTLAWADPARDLAVAIFANRSVKSLWMFRPTRWADMSDDICRVADNLS